jgi:hypothetical protein
MGIQQRGGDHPWECQGSQSNNVGIGSCVGSGDKLPWEVVMNMSTAEQVLNNRTKHVDKGRVGKGWGHKWIE